jgi:hypothetical protein
MLNIEGRYWRYYTRRLPIDLELFIMSTSSTEKYAILANKYDTVTVIILLKTILGSCFSGLINSSIKKFKSTKELKK